MPPIANLNNDKPQVRGGRTGAAFREFFQTEVAGGVILLTCAIIALIWANSPWGGSYEDLWSTSLSLGLGDLQVGRSLQGWIKDLLMAIFFFVVGLEIKREVLTGELASARRATLPVAAALGGAVVPAIIFIAFNAGTDGARGWGIPMATDIAFALGVLSLIGGAGAALLRVFLTAVAIVDDLLAVLVIAMFYSVGLAWSHLVVAALILAVLIGANRFGVQWTGLYLLLGIVLWAVFLESGVHPTLAGVLLALTIPTNRGNHDEKDVADTPPAAAVHGHHTYSMLERLEHTLHPWVAFGIMPLFALANAGVEIGGGALSALDDRIALGILFGLILGKQLGITLAAWLVVRLGLAEFPVGLRLRHVYAVSWLTGIGFTMSIFIANLAFPESEQLTEAKVGITVASILAGIGGFLLLRLLSPRVDEGNVHDGEPDVHSHHP